MQSHEIYGNGSGDGHAAESLRALRGMLRRRRGVILGFFLAVMAGVFLYLAVAPRTYRSEGRLLIRAGRENAAVDPSVMLPARPVLQSREDEVNSELAILQSRALAERTVDQVGAAALLGRRAGSVDRGFPLLAGTLERTGLRPPLTERERAIKVLSRQLKIQVQPKSSIIDLSYEARDPELARRVVEAAIGIYQEFHIAAHRSQASPDFFAGQVKALEQRLRAGEEALARYRREHGITLIDNQLQVQLQQASRLRTQLEETASQQRASEAKTQALTDMLKNRSATTELSRTQGKTNYAADAFKEQVNALTLKEAEMSARYPADYRPLVSLREQIAVARRMLDGEQNTLTEVTTGLDAGYQSLRLTLDAERAQQKALLARTGALEKDLARQQEEIAQLTMRKTELARLERDVAQLEKEYLNYRDGLQKASISQALDLDKVSNISLVQPASRSADPISPRPLRLLLLGLMAGLAGGVLLGLTLEHFDDTLKDRREVEQWMDLPVLATISRRAMKECA